MKHPHFRRMVNRSALFVVRVGNIVEVAAEAIVTSANSRLAGGGGVDGAIHRAGGPSIMAQCRLLGGCPTGKAVVTGAGNLRARIVIHAVGPRWSGGRQGEPDLLRSAYRESLLQAAQHAARSVIFPSISTGFYGYPITEAAPIAIQTVLDFLRTSQQVHAAGFVLSNHEAYKVYERAARQILDRPPLGCYWSYYEASDALYLHPLHLDMRDEDSLPCARWLRSLAEDQSWEEDTLRLLEDRGWREHLGAAVSYYLCRRSHPAVVSALWRALTRGSWVSPQLLVVLSQRDSDFAQKLEDLLAAGVRSEDTGTTQVDQVAKYPGEDDRRLGKIANAALGLARTGVWKPTAQAEARAREWAAYDEDGADEIAVRWLESLRHFEQQA